MTVLCNREDCKFINDQNCTAGQVGIVDRQCVTYRMVKRQDDYRQLMRPAFSPNCDRSGRKSNPATGVLK